MVAVAEVLLVVKTEHQMRVQTLERDIIAGEERIMEKAEMLY